MTQSTDGSLSPPDTKPTAKGIRWWPALIILSLLVCALGWVWLQDADDAQQQVMKTLPILSIAFLALILWWLFLARLSTRQRVFSLLGLLTAGILAASLLEVRGVNGNLVPVLGWRFAEEPPLETTGPVDGPRIQSSLEPTDYPQYLGQGRDGVVFGTSLAGDWSTNQPRELWRREVGAGWSSVAVLGQAAITQEQRGELELVTRYDLATGEAVWSHSSAVRYASVIGGVGPRATPTIDGDRVFALGATGLLSALDLLSGEQLWSRDILDDHGATSPEWGKSCSPLVVEERVIVSVGAPGGWSLVAYHRATGEVLWHSGDDLSSYSSPMLAEMAGVKQILIFNQGSLSAHALDTGATLWTLDWPASQPNVAQPLSLPGDRILVSTGYGIGSKLLQIRGPGDGDWSAEEIWESRRLKAKFATPIAHGDYIYGLDDGVLTCIDIATGSRQWKAGRYGHGQILLVGDYLLIQAEDGTVVLVEATPEEHRESGRLSALAGKTWNPPVLSGSTLLVRNDQEMAAYSLPTL